MRYHVMTLFPDMIMNAMYESITGRAISSGYIKVNAVNIRDYADNKHNRVDDYPYGGGAGMLMQAEPVYRCFEDIIENISKENKDISDVPVIYLSPQGKVFDQSMAEELSQKKDIIFLCGHYEGIDERVLETIVTDYVSIGDYVLTGGELPALVMMDAVSRLVPGVLTNADSGKTESFAEGLLEYPQYTRPSEWRGMKVPDVLLSGHHKNLEKWYREQSLIRTAKLRPDLIEKAEISEAEMELLDRMGLISVMGEIK